MFYGKNSHQCIILRIALNLLGSSNMGSFLTIVVKLYSYIDSDVGNLQKIKYFTIILDTRIRREIKFR